MNSTKNIAVLGGDARYLEMVKNMSKSDHIHIELVGFDQLKQGFSGARQIDIEDLDLSKLDAIILPIPGTNEEGYIETVFSDKKIQITAEWLKKLPKHCLVFSGIATNHLQDIVKEANLSLFPLMNRNDVAIYNSIPTVEGTIMIAIQNTDFTIHSSKVIVLGLGRVGMSVASKFAALGADVYVGSRSKEDIARATEMGLTGFHMGELSAYTAKCNILINTVPAMVVTDKVIQPMPSNALIIDLASKPGGTDFDYAEKRGIKALHSLGLPGMVAPKTAGEILGHVIEQIIYEEHLGEE
ncbi:dipicolinic acid synthetase subunit A [Aquibacillus koreensis]|uniref:Dipicolinic acid synthetase subunit A n=1 Tax=Aquibacillus koreensis TaxID=279446 RepID=A0A9X3WQL8_9BACI|nr:dipicolinic acid synthetase subunit A [Aquibacillus koreensis]MCT2534575.1 dipicolinic acid synthetase subunit A [Aquibacillus koreensis]MDC3421831.1 dipicolinic acid synthetase subunit A [Aquibacillus koreensis]